VSQISTLLQNGPSFVIPIERSLSLAVYLYSCIFATTPELGTVSGAADSYSFGISIILKRIEWSLLPTPDRADILFRWHMRKPLAVRQTLGRRQPICVHHVSASPLSAAYTTQKLIRPAEIISRPSSKVCSGTMTTSLPLFCLVHSDMRHKSVRPHGRSDDL
jgi:hypothetical protein